MIFHKIKIVTLFDVGLYQYFRKRINKITRYNINGNFLWIKFIFYVIKKQMILINVMSLTKIAICFMTFLKWGT